MPSTEQPTLGYAEINSNKWSLTLKNSHVVWKADMLINHYTVMILKRNFKKEINRILKRIIEF